METDWTKHWEGPRNNFAWRTWVWRMTRAYKNLLKNINLNNPEILELGSGSGTNSLIIANTSKAKKITLTDFNKKALELSSETFKNSGFNVVLLNENVLDLNLKEKFDIVHSEGLIEHFYGKDRTAVFQKHVNFCKENGFIIIFVPYKSIQYNVFKWLYKRLNKWIWEEEIFSRQELFKLCKHFNLKILKVYTSPLIPEIGILAKKQVKG